MKNSHGAHTVFGAFLGGKVRYDLLNVKVNRACARFGDNAAAGPSSTIAYNDECTSAGQHRYRTNTAMPRPHRTRLEYNIFVKARQ